MYKTHPCLQSPQQWGWRAAPLGGATLADQDAAIQVPQQKSELDVLQKADPCESAFCYWKEQVDAFLALHAARDGPATAVVDQSAMMTFSVRMRLLFSVR